MKSYTCVACPYRQMRVLFNAFDTHFPPRKTYILRLYLNGKKDILTASGSTFNITDFNERLQGLFVFV